MKPLLILISILLLLTSPLISSEKKNDYDGKSKEGLPHVDSSSMNVLYFFFKYDTIVYGE